MATETQSFAGAVQGRITAPTRWTIVNGFLKRWTTYGAGEINGDSFGQMTFDTYSAGLRTISAPMRWNSAGASSEWGFCALNAARTGFSLIVKNTSTTLRKEVAGAAGTTIATLSTTNTANAAFSMDFNDSTGAITVKKDGATVLTGTYTDTPTLKLGLQSYNSGTAQSYASVTIDYTPAQTVTSINGGLPITSSQSAVAAITTGFSGLPASITANNGITCGSITGATNAPNWVQNIRTDGAVFPKNGTSVTYTFINGSETASLAQTINKDADQTAVIVASPINDDITCLFGAIFATTGRSAANTDEVYHVIPAPMLTKGIDTILPADAIAPDGTMQFYNAGTFPCWVWTNATGINYYYSVTITENGSVIVETPASNTKAISNAISRAISNSITTLH